MLSRKEYLEFFRELFPLFREHAKADAYIAFLNADWREFQGKSPREEDPSKSIFLSHYINEFNFRPNHRNTNRVKFLATGSLKTPGPVFILENLVRRPARGTAGRRANISF